jgi:hypothetical protein
VRVAIEEEEEEEGFRLRDEREDEETVSNSSLKIWDWKLCAQ